MIIFLSAVFGRLCRQTETCSFFHLQLGNRWQLSATLSSRGRMGMLQGWRWRGHAIPVKSGTGHLMGFFREATRGRERGTNTLQLKGKTSIRKNNSPHPVEYLISGHVDPSGKETLGSLCGRSCCLCRP